MNTLERVDHFIAEGKISREVGEIAREFLSTHADAQEKGLGKRLLNNPLLDFYLDQIAEQVANPYPFEPYHERLCAPTDYYGFGIDFIRPLTDLKHSFLEGKSHLTKMTEQLAAGENVILFGNHQSELDPQILSLLLEKEYPKLATSMIFVAGHRVVTDPIAIPFSLGRNLLCIYSKRHIANPPEERSDKQMHNQRTMKLMGEMLKEGGTCIYVAPSGGRDRKGANGKVELASFDAAATELFILKAKQAKTPTHFYPLALISFDLLPPPAKVEEALGERRAVAYTPLLAGFGPEIELDRFPGHENPNKRERREARGKHIFSLMAEQYEHLRELKSD